MDSNRFLPPPPRGTAVRPRPGQSLQPAVLIALLVLLMNTVTLVQAQEYKLGAGDMVRITVYDYPDLTTDARLSEAGVLSFPLIGEVSLRGLSAAEAERLIASRLSQGGFVTQPHVLVLVSQFVSHQVAILGEVGKAGRYPLDSVRKLTDLLAIAGGVTANAGDRAILVRSGAETRGRRIVIDLDQLFHGDESLNHEIGSGDVVYVPKAPVFYIYGEVQRPGMYRLERGMTVSQALSVGGGLTPRGSESSVTITRRGPDAPADPVDAELDHALTPDDVLQVGERWY